jgi:hypothetical protein
MFKKNITFLIILLTYTSLIYSSPTESKTEMESQIELLQESMDFNNKNTTNHKVEDRKSSFESSINKRVLTVNKGMNIAGNIKTKSVLVNDLYIGGKADITLQIKSENIKTKKISTESLSVEKIISTDVFKYLNN